MSRVHQRCCCHPRMIAGVVMIAAVLLAASAYAGIASQPAGTARKVKVKIRDEKPVIVERVLPIDPNPHITLRWGSTMNFSPFVDNKRLIFSAQGGIITRFKIDNRIVSPGTAPGRITVNRAALPQRPGRRRRQGWKTVYVYGNIEITQIVELVPTRPKGKPQAGQKRRIDAALVRYFIKNKDNRPHEVGLRLSLDTLLVNNDGCLWAAPNQKGKILNGVEIKKKMIPDYLQVLQQPNLKNPGYVSHWTFNLGRGRERPTRIVLTAHGREFTPWDVQAVRANGDTGMAIFWDPRTVKAKSKVEFAYAYGEGIASIPENEGKVGVVLGGSFEPGKLFTITAHVMDPVPGQWLQLKLPKGMKLMEGQEVQPVPAPSERGNSLVLWKGRVLRPGEFTLRIRSSTGVTQTKVVTIARVQQ